MPFKHVRNMLVIQLHINNAGPYNFILDTGVGLMLITEPNLVDSIHLTNKRTVKIPGLGEGGDAEAFVTPPLNVDIPGLKSYAVSAAILKKDHFNLSSYVGMPIHGLLGYEFFNNLAVKINFSDSTVTVCRPADIKMLKKGTRIPITVEEKKPYLDAIVKLTDGTLSINKLIIDLGAGHPISLDNFIKNKGLPQKFIAANLGIGLNGPISGFISRVAEVDLGNYKIKDVLTSMPGDKNTNTRPSIARDGNLGMDILKRFTIVFDYTGNAMYLKKGRGFKEPFEHDMSGLEYFGSGKDHKVVIISRVEPGSPAYDIGLEKDDQIVSINFKPVTEMTLEQIDNLLRSRDQRTLLLEIYHDKVLERVIITLKRRI
ncbi:hypothetical protein GCM10023149_46960 [Mucilaginibacter gynuensis]|uniref:PDZ domain-containing protein n=2 Tax=Mucilaginibacter gynuensis TaxID=1302236 RepID=A0ABP8HCR9_9SPHI